MQSLITRLSFDTDGDVDPLEGAVEKSWQLRFIILLWLSHLLLTPFDLATISSSGPQPGDRQAPPSDIDAFIPSPDTPFPEKLAALPQLCKTLLLLATKMLPSSLPRESDAAALLIVRLAIRKDMRGLGLLEAVVEWCLRCWEDNPTGQDIDLLSTHESTINPLFLRTGSLRVLAGLLTQSESTWVRDHIPKIWSLVTATEDKAGPDWSTEAEAGAGEWSSSLVRKVSTKIYRWTGTLILTAGIEQSENSSEIVEDVIGRLLNLLGDRDTNVRFAASKSLGVLTAKLPEAMASEVVNAVVGGFDEDVLYEYEDEVLSKGQSLPTLFGDFPEAGRKKKQLLVSVSPERWHGLTLTLATFLRQRAIKPHALSPSQEEDEEESTTPLFQLIIRRILTALTFDQRKTTFSLGSNVRDAACYAAWALARSYYTKELLTIPLPEEYSSYPDPAHVSENIIQLLAANLVATACLDPVGNIRRGSSAALQELVGRHPNIVQEGISVVQTVDYSGVSVQRRAVTEIARDAAGLHITYWYGLTRWGLVEAWRGVGNGDAECRRIAARGLGALVSVKQPGEEDDTKAIERGRRLVGWLLHRAVKEARKDVEVRHGVYWALAEVLEGLATLKPVTGTVFSELQQSILLDVFHFLGGRDFIHPPLRPELTAEGASRLVTALCKVFLPTLGGSPLLTSPLPISLQRSCLAVVEATLEFRPEDLVLEQVIPATRELFRALDRQTGMRIVEEWCRRVVAEGLTTAELPMTAAGSTASGGSGMGRKRGFVGGLGEVLSVLLGESYADPLQNEKRERIIVEVVEQLVAAAMRKGNVEMRVAGIKAITRGIMSAPAGKRIDITRFPGLVDVLLASFDDYSIDTRGDVGSWVRTEGITAIVEGWRSGILRFGLRIRNPGQAGDGAEIDVMEELITRLVRVSVEKLDRLRVKAFLALRDILHRPEDAQITSKSPVSSIADIGRLIDFSQQTDAATNPAKSQHFTFSPNENSEAPESFTDSTVGSYFTALLPILSAPIEKLTRAFLAGYVVSAGSGSDSLLKVSGSALWRYLDEADPATLLRTAGALVEVLEGKIPGVGERVVGAALEVVGGGFESGVLGGVVALPGGVGAQWGKKVFMATQRAHKGAGSVGRLVGAVRVYRGLGLACAGAVVAVGRAEEDRERDEDGNVAREAEKLAGMVRRKLVGMLVHPFPLVRREVGEGLFICLTVCEETVGGGGDVQGAVEVLVETDWMGKLDAGPAKGKGEKEKGRGVKGEMARLKVALGLV